MSPRKSYTALFVPVYVREFGRLLQEQYSGNPHSAYRPGVIGTFHENATAFAGKTAKLPTHLALELGSVAYPIAVSSTLPEPFRSRYAQQPPPLSWRALTLAVVSRDASTCAYCGTKRRVEVVDCVVPGRDLDSELRPDDYLACCALCKHAKGDLSVDRWKADWLSRGRSWPPNWE